MTSETTTEGRSWTIYICSYCGYAPGNRRNWCNAGCGSDYNEMVPVTVVALDDALAALRTDDAREAIRYQGDKSCTGGIEEDWTAAERSVDDLARFLAERFGVSS